MAQTFHLKYALGISGAAETSPCAPNAPQLAEAVGRFVAQNNCVLVTGATTGIPYWAAKGAKEAGGTVIGFSPATSEREHVKKYHLPVDFHDVIIYTGSGYAGRNLQLTRAAHGVIFVCGRMGTLNEFTIAFEDEKPMAILEDSGPFQSTNAADPGFATFKEIVQGAHRGPGKIVYEKNPELLVKNLLELIKKEESGNYEP